ncbi:MULTISPECIES: energy-coupling factor transporter transmembrane protein EcfT [unclassified Rhizobium]|uniref:energy-coupling factor transporter transmembrane component T family protein n=1 Tax=unclassified Rhizobium TaxID=2613769 RepID=UPI001620E5F4|nr:MULTISPECIES: energy-coupling factor transporter transmembrane protein EcfT [unclassified Rhizobium]MBB3539997.1 biotin transport system permease protein [Rhizobium sp. BK399]MCS3738993.1 biotin transport system permease protein [Rhizobium sp. BK661]MCS4090682.1 biotin transport system permease protein [Rhizobium sp. BK176]
MKSLFVEGNSVMHRVSARAKLLVLAALGVVLFLTTNLMLLGLGVLATAVVAFSIGLPARSALARLKPIFLTILIVALFSLAFNPWHVAIVALLRLTALMLFAAAVTATTTIAQFIDEITLLARPLERLGLLRAGDVGLAVGLVVRFVPEIIDRYRAIREAHAARGIKVRPTTVLVPLVILTLRDADNIAAAIDARGVRRHVN